MVKRKLGGILREILIQRPHKPGWGETAAYPGYAYDYYYGIPYGSLYRILLEEGYEVNGDWTKYEFTGKDGTTHACIYQAEGEISMQVDELNAVTDLMLDDGTKMQTVVIDGELLGILHMDAAEFAAGLEALDGDYYRSMIVEGNSVRIRGKAREFSRLVRFYEARLKELSQELKYYDSGYGFVYNNLHRVYQGITLRMGSDVPREKMESIADEAVGLTALCSLAKSAITVPSLSITRTLCSIFCCFLLLFTTCVSQFTVALLPFTSISVAYTYTPVVPRLL